MLSIWRFECAEFFCTLSQNPRFTLIFHKIYRKCAEKNCTHHSKAPSKPAHFLEIYRTSESVQKISAPLCNLYCLSDYCKTFHSNTSITFVTPYFFLLFSSLQPLKHRWHRYIRICDDYCLNNHFIYAERWSGITEGQSATNTAQRDSKSNIKSM